MNEWMKWKTLFMYQKIYRTEIHTLIGTPNFKERIAIISSFSRVPNQGRLFFLNIFNIPVVYFWIHRLVCFSEGCTLKASCC